ncbi:MFS transporter [Bacillus sp. AK031]
MLFGLGISTLGDFIYLVAINILVLKMTGSAAAVAGLWIIGPIAAILTKFWSGSLIDRMNKRKIMIGTDIIRALLVALIPFCQSIFFIYILLFLLSISKSFFEPASIAYITGLIPEGDRKRFNSFRSLISSSAFLIGPAISGVLLIFVSVDISIWINSISFLLSGMMLMMLPDVMGEPDSRRITLGVLKEDWKNVFRYSAGNRFVVTIYFLSQFFMVIALGMDAQEVVFTQDVLALSETDYGFLISITGIGSILGAAAISAAARKLSIKVMMSMGFALVSLGYLIYAFSFSFWSVALGFVILGFFNPFWGTGFMTFYQNNVPVGMMGRISSVFGIFQSVLQVSFILLVGFTGEIIPLRYSIMAASFLMGAIALLLIVLINQSEKAVFEEESISDSTR